jgi:hypothetical protein
MAMLLGERQVKPPGSGVLEESMMRREFSYMMLFVYVGSAYN